MKTNTDWESLEADGYPGYEINANGDVRTLDGNLVQPTASGEGYSLPPSYAWGSKEEFLAGHFGNPEIDDNFYK